MHFFFFRSCRFSTSTSAGSCHSPHRTSFTSSLCAFCLLTSIAWRVFFSSSNSIWRKAIVQECPSLHHLPTPLSIPIDVLIYYFSSKFNQKIAISFYDWKTINGESGCEADAEEKKSISNFNIAKIGSFFSASGRHPGGKNEYDNEQFNAMKVNAWNENNSHKNTMKKSQLTRQLPNEWACRIAGSFARTHTHTQPIIYSWTIKTVSREIFGAMRLFIFCPTLSRRAFLFIRSHSRRIQASEQWQRRRQQRPYLWRFLFSISSQFLVFGSTYVDWKKGERKWNEIRALPLIRMTKRRWRTRLTNAPSARALVVTLMACRTQWWVNELLKNALVVRSMTELRHRTQSDEKKRNEYEYKKKKWCSPVCNLVE